MSSIHLHGSEAVADAGRAMQSAACEMLRAANMLEDCTRRLEILLGQGYGSNLERLVGVLEREEEKAVALEQIR